MEDKMFSQMRSSVFVSRGALAAMLFFGVLSAIFRATALCVAFSLLFFFCLASRLWGRHSLAGVEITFCGEPAALFPGQRARFDFVIKNGKLMPVIWLEIVALLDGSAPLYPANGGEVKKLAEAQAIDEGIEAESAEMLYKKFVFVMGQEEIVWQSVWEARRRGIYRPASIRARTGDGFGLTQCESRLQLPPDSCIAVYPAVCPVIPDIFLRDMHNAAGAARGFIEDITVIRSTRDYLPNDPARRINWRATARGQQTVVNSYETILPKSAHFIIDGESFNGLPAAGAALEDALSIAASLLIRLKEAGLRCGLSLPKSRGSAAKDIFAPESTPLAEMLFALAGYELCELEMPEDGSDQKPKVRPARFNQSAILSLLNVGRFYYICRDLSSIKAMELVSRMEPARMTLLPYRLEQGKGGASLFEFDVFELKKLKRRGGDE